jgi:hypothetical protein
MFQNLKIIVSFEADDNWSKRMDKIKEKLQGLMPIDVVEAKLNKVGYPDIDYGCGDADLVFADSITVTYNQIVRHQMKDRVLEELAKL